MNFTKRAIYRILVGIIPIAGSSLAVAAGSIVQGGGSSLVAPVFGSTNNPASEIGLFGTSGEGFTYYPYAVNGAGVYAFLNNQPTFFGQGVTGAVHFATSEAGLTTAQVTSYNASTIGANSGPLIQIPYIVTAITVPIVNGPTVTSSITPQTTPSQTHSIALNDDDLCGIFSGKLTNWNQILNPEYNYSYPFNQAITVVYQSNSSGTTELLTRHLAAVCTRANTKAGTTFVDSPIFANTTAFPTGTPSNFIAASGDMGARRSLASLWSAGIGAVAYLSPAYSNTYLAPSSAVVTSSGALQLPIASLYNSMAATYYAPTYANATKALGTISAPSIFSAAIDPTQWVPVSGPAYAALANPASGYPVSGTSQIILSQCYADPTVMSNVQNFLNNHYTNTSYASVVHGNGFDTVPSSFKSAILANFLSNTSGNNLDIGDASACTFITGR